DAEPVSNTTGSDGAWSISGIDPGTWKVREIAPAADPAWNCSLPNGDTPNGGVDDFGCFYTVDTNDGTLATSGLDFGNYQNVTITVTKHTDPDTATRKFAFSSDLSDGSFLLGNGESQTFDNLTPGISHTTSEDVPDGWLLSSITCSSSLEPESE